MPNIISKVTGPFQLLPLPYKEDGLAPYISSQTIGFHYGKHHQGYITKINGLVKDTPFAEKSFEDIIRQTAGQPEKQDLFNNAAQAWNHAFYWKSMKPKGGGKPGKKIAGKIESSFGNYENFKKAFSKAALSRFGSGWAWLVSEKDVLKIVTTHDADTPIAHKQTPLLTVDVWEHAYYLDYQNKRADYIAACLEHLLDWDFAAENLSHA